MITADVERIEAMGIRCITGDFAAEGDVLRHASDRVAATLLRIVMEVKGGPPLPPASGSFLSSN